jgi:hypothetical protein
MFKEHNEKIGFVQIVGEKVERFPRVTKGLGEGVSDTE